MKIELAKTEIVHFIGIGGIGMSGLSLIMKGKEFSVQGSDISLNKNTVVGDKNPMNPGGVRIGTPAMTTRGFNNEDFELAPREVTIYELLLLNWDPINGIILTKYCH